MPVGDDIKSWIRVINIFIRNHLLELKFNKTRKQELQWKVIFTK